MKLVEYECEGEEGFGGVLRTGLGDPECSLDVLDSRIFFLGPVEGELLEWRMLLAADSFLGNFGGSLLGDRFSGLRDACREVPELAWGEHGSVFFLSVEEPLLIGSCWDLKLSGTAGCCSSKIFLTNGRFFGMSGGTSCEPFLTVEGGPVITLLRTVSIGVDGIVLLSVEGSSRSLAVEKFEMEERPQ